MREKNASPHSLKLTLQFPLQKKKFLHTNTLSCAYRRALNYFLKKSVNHNSPILGRLPLIDSPIH